MLKPLAISLIRVLRRFQSSRKRDLLVLVFLAADLLLGALVVYYFENAAIADPASEISYQDCVWLALTTATTVGYGDKYATTMGGRLASILFFYVGGVGVAAYLLGRVVEIGLDFRIKKRKGFVTVNLEDHIVICNYPSTRMVEQMIHELGADPRSKERSVVIVTDAVEELGGDHADVHFVHGNPMDEEPLTRAGVAEAWMAIVLAPDLDVPHADALVSADVAMVKGLNPNCICVAQCADRARETLLRTCGADRLVFAGNLASNLIVQEAIDCGVSGLIESFSSNRDGAQFYSEHNEVDSLTVSQCDKALKELDVCAHLLALHREKEGAWECVTLPQPDTAIRAGDYIIYVARHRLDWTEVQGKLR